MAAAPAQPALLDLPECLEMILLELDNATLLTTAQRVCKTWHSIITGSQRLQRKLFFAPPTDVEARQPRKQNPLLASVFPAFFNTGLQDKLSSQEALKTLASRGVDDQRTAAQRREPLLREGASWRRMYPEAPTSFKIGYVETRGSSELAFYSGVLDVPEGITMGKLYDLAYSMHLGRGFEDAHFAVYWREKSQDPDIHAYSWKYGMEEVALSQLADDVKIVICPKIRRSKLLPEVKKDLKALYMPADLELCTIELQYASSQDWFG